MKKVFENLFQEKCPVCGSRLVVVESDWSKDAYGKECPGGHFCKEVHAKAEVVIQKPAKC
jgi:hypothetical protein